MSAEPRCWIGVAARAHVRIGVSGGFCQLGHGKAAPVKRLQPGDLIAYYSPSETMGGGDKVQAFTAIGRIKPGDAYEADAPTMAGGYRATRRDVDWFDAQEASIRPLIPILSFIRDKARWAAPFRFGVVRAPRDDFARIADAMGVRERIS